MHRKQATFCTQAWSDYGRVVSLCLIITTPEPRFPVFSVQATQDLGF